MNVVLDTNVIVSGLLTSNGTCARIIDRMIEGDFRVCVDDRILVEYERTLDRPSLAVPKAARQDLMEFLRYGSLRVNAAPLDARLPDPTDLPFLEVAREAEAILVTGNSRHFPDKQIGRTPVVTPREFLELLKKPS
jgi:putative PIN family toxin of toxin-antitoxin system